MDPATGKRIYFYSKDPKVIDQKVLAFTQKVEKGPLLKEIAEAWKAEHFPTLAYTTIHGYTPAYTRIVDTFGEEHVKEITVQQITEYLRRFSKEKGYKTVTNELLVFRLILGYACSLGILANNPAQYARIPKGLPRKPRDFPADADINIVKASCDILPPWGFLHYFTLYTGARVGEAMALTWGDVDFEKRIITITKSVYWENNQPQLKTTKTESGIREIPILDKLHTILLSRKGQPDEYLFAIDGRIPSHTMLSRGRNRFRKLTGTTATPHQLRHAFATMLYEADIKEKTAQYLLGHAQLSTTMDIYTQLRKRELVDAAKKLNDIDIAT